MHDRSAPPQQLPHSPTPLRNTHTTRLAALEGTTLLGPSRPSTRERSSAAPALLVSCWSTAPHTTTHGACPQGRPFIAHLASLHIMGSPALQCMPSQSLSGAMRRNAGFAVTGLVRRTHMPRSAAEACRPSIALVTVQLPGGAALDDACKHSMQLGSSAGTDILLTYIRA